MIFNLSAKKHEDALIFQVSEGFIEVSAVRRAPADKGENVRMTELLYSQRLPRVVPAKKSLDDLTLNIGKLADTAVLAHELKVRDFVVAEAKVVCVFVEPLSIRATTTYAAKLKQEAKVTKQLLQKAFKRGEVTHDDLKDVPATYATYAEVLESVTLNGYSTKQPLGKNASRVELTFAQYLITPELWAAVGSVLERTFHRELIYLHKASIIELDSEELSEEIYTGGELQVIARDIL